MRILVTYATCHGSTAEIARRIADRLQRAGDTVECRPVYSVNAVDAYGAVVLGSAIHNQVWLPEATEFLEHFGTTLSRASVWLFSVGMPGALPRRLGRLAQWEGGQMEVELSSLIRYRGHRLFSGVIRKEHLTSAGRTRFRLIGGRYGDFRDWAEIEHWADSILDVLLADPQQEISA